LGIGGLFIDIAIFLPPAFFVTVICNGQKVQIPSIEIILTSRDVQKEQIFRRLIRDLVEN
jgi:hypothetical protein